ncbi:hypothetical protein [Helicobacter cappadocius]|uniref:Uncharacterized protein n=1 Tax=Helicobacter cappadocius TaxID=3063998 RepID=A0AA90PHR4_9HELI|nr:MULTISPECIES: hypothetical protein [unclassified Helicobacter]MDO7252635.1 hypothetical protein [Helicobacter sp. faydin-H75]MDP2538502.1 hypothetical protein [Helicobacter sp. faydin-H76]
MRKIFKYDFLDNYLGILFIDILVCLSILGMGFFSQTEYAKYFASDIINMICFITLIVSGFLWFAFIILAVLDSINKKMFSLQGYLTFSLPLKIDEILIPKILINVFWIAFSSILLAITLYINTFWNHYGMLDMFFRQFIAGILSHPFWTFLAYVNFLVWIALFLVKFLLVLGILNIGKIKKYRLMIGILIFIALQIILEIIKNQFSIFVPNLRDFYNSIFAMNDSLLYTQGYGIQILINTIELLVIYAIARYLIKNKLELE